MDPEKRRSWLFGIAYRSFLDHTRKTKRRQTLAQQQALDVERAMDSLPPDCRAVVMLCLLHGLTHSEAATATGLPLGTVKSHVGRGKTKLRAILTEYAPRQKTDRSIA